MRPDEPRPGTPPPPVPSAPTPDAFDATESQTPSARFRSKERSSQPPGTTASRPDWPAPNLDVPPPVPGYRPVEPLGEGTYGKVWLFEKIGTGIRVAVKFFTRRTSQKWHLLQAEVQQLARLHADPGIVQLLEVAPEADPPYYVMTYAAGGSLARKLEGGRTLGPREALRVIRRAAEALAYVHSKGICHCDLKPGNVLLDSRGRALLGDFGQAHLASDLTPSLGTYFYMAPEQATLDEGLPDPRWDVYGLGAVLYTMLVGRPPREDADLRVKLTLTPELRDRLRLYREHVRTAPPPVEHRKVRGVDGPLATILDRCLAVEPAKRYRDAGAVLQALAARDRQRRQRPILYFGLVAPLLLLLALGLSAAVAFSRTLDKSRATVTHRVQHSDRVAARLMANVLQQRLTIRANSLRNFAREPDFLQAVRAGDWDGVRAVLRAWDEKPRATNQKAYSRWIFTDPSGVMRADLPHDPTTIGRHWGWRDYFNGQGDRPDAKDARYEPIRRPHVSQPFVGHGKGNVLSVAISVPVFEPADDALPPAERRLLGVLTGRVAFADLYQWLEGVEMEHGFAVVYDSRGHCLIHRDAEAISPRLDENPVRWPERSAELRALLDSGDGVAEYTDPIDGKTYLAGHAAFKRDDNYAILPLDWDVLVQHERGEALAPVQQLRAQLASVGWSTLGVAGLLTAALWAWLVRTLRREELPAHA